MMVGVILRDKYGKRAAEQISKLSKHFDVQTFELPAKLPVLIEDASSYLKGFSLDVDVLISYALHPDINLELIKMVAGRVKMVIIPGGARSGSRAQLKKIAEKYGVKVLLEEICCTSESNLLGYFGKPEFEVEIEGGRIKEVKVLRAAICGSSYFVAENLKGVSINDAPARAGYLTQIYPCYASSMDGIHSSARVHRGAIEKAIKAFRENK
jgi:hypothetical protein